MNKYKVEGYITIPVEVIIEAKDASDATIHAEVAVMDEFPQGCTICAFGEIEYQFAGEEEKVIINLGDDYEYDFNRGKLK